MNDLTPYLVHPGVSSSGKAASHLAPPIIDLVNEVEQQTEAFALRDYWQVVATHRRLIAAFFVGVVLTTAVILSMMTPIYTAHTTILIERNPPRVVDMPQATSEPLASDEYDYYKTQYEILKSRSLASQVIEEKGLESNPLLAESGIVAGLGSSAVAGLGSHAKEWLQQYFPPSSNLSQGNTAETSKFIDRYIHDMLDITPVRGTNLVTLGFSSPDPELSAQVANAHAQAYIRYGLTLRTRANQEAHRFLEEKLVELKERVERSEDALNRYRRDKNILSLDSKENIVVERLGELNKRLTETEIERITLEAQVQLVRQRHYDSLPAVVSSPLIQTLKDQLIRLEGEQANLSTQFKSGYPRLAQVKAQVEEVRSRLQQEIQKVVDGVESSYLAARTKERDLRVKMEAQKAAAMQLKDAAVNYAILAREADTNSQLYDSVLERMKQIGVAAELRASNVVIVDKAEPPLHAARPKTKLSLLLSAMAGLLGGIGLAFFRKSFDNTFHTPEEAERFLSLPNLGRVPDFLSLNRGFLRRAAMIGRRSARKQGNGATESEMVFYPSDPDERPVYPLYPFGFVGEAYRTLRTGILLSEVDEPAKTVLFTSAVHGEGKTATVVNSAITFAQMGVKVLLIDGDLRRPACHKILGMRKGLGIAELLSGDIKPTWAIQPTHVPNLFFISGGSSSLNPTELLGSNRMRQTLLLARQHYDYILIDSPPVMAVSDSVLLSTMVDGVVLVVRGQETPRHIVKQACSRLRYARAKILGMVLNRMDPRSDGDYRYYSYAEPGGQEA